MDERSTLRLVWSSSWSIDHDRLADVEIRAAVLIHGEHLARAGGFELPDEWQYFVLDWLREHRPNIYGLGVQEDDVLAAFAAWEIGWAR